MNENKEYIKYEDGKVVSIKDEGLPKEKQIAEKIKDILNNIKKKKEEINREEKKEEIKKELVNIFSFKNLFLIFLILFPIVTFSIYKEPIKEAIGLLKAPAVQQTLGNEEVPNKEEIETPSIQKEEDKKEEIETPVNDYSFYRNINKVNEKIDAYLSVENDTLSKYFNNKKNKISTQNQFDKIIYEKASLYKELTSMDITTKRDEELCDFLSERLINSIKRSQSILDYLIQGGSASTLQTEIENFDEVDGEIRTSFIFELVEILEDQSVNYKILNNNIVIIS